MWKTDALKIEIGSKENGSEKMMIFVPNIMQN